MIEIFLMVKDAVLNVLTLGWWGRSQGNKLYDGYSVTRKQ